MEPSLEELFTVQDVLMALPDEDWESYQARRANPDLDRM